MDNVYCLACGSGYASRPQDGPMKLYACVRCIASRGYALFCDVCRLRWHSQNEEAVCPRCVEETLARDHGLYPEFKGRP